ncbi:MAG TPA: type IX secretion system sortase PorU [Flavobacterium sp.]|jgi:hypothetical protein
MNKLLTFLLLVCGVSGYSQQSGEIILEWQDQSKISNGIYDVVIPKVDSENFIYDHFNGTVYYKVLTKVTTAVDASSVQISNVVFESIQPSQLGSLKAAGIPSAINAVVKNVKSRDDISVSITISPIIKDGSSFKRVKSFSYNITGTNRRISNVSAPAIITNSVLSSGDWYRFYVERSGVYKISKSFIQSLGMNTSVDPGKIKIYGNGGRMLPLLNSTPYPMDLEENAIQVIGEDDGSFDSNDYILFYAEGVDNWNADSQTHNNIYADRSYYYITSQGGDGKRISPMDPLNGSTLPVTQITTFDDYQFHEKDLTNVVRLGRRWFGEQFNIENVQDFDFNFPNIVTSSPISINVYAAAAAFTPTSFTVKANGQQVGTINFSTLSGGIELDDGSLPSTASIPATENVNISLNYNNNGVPGSRGFLDYIILRATRNLKGYGDQFRFRYNNAATLTGIGEYTISTASGISQVWDITDIYNVTKAENPSLVTFTFRAHLGEVREYIAIDPSDYYTPLKESNSRVANQNIKGTIFTNAQGAPQDVDYIIVTPSSLQAKAEKLADFHRNYSQLNVKVVNLESIYTEFGSGKQDIAAIRNLVKYVYINSLTPAGKVKYLNLFGDASFDFKDRIPNNTNIIPIYHAINSYSAGEGSFATDDFFGMLDPDEGRIDAFGQNISSYEIGGIDVAVGRMIVDNANQADDMVQKVIDYHDYKSYGSWRNNYVFIADDSDKTSDAALQARQNQLANVISTQKPFINVNKIFLDSFLQETSAGGNRYPNAREDLFNAFEKGALIFNYLGHGGEDGLSGERIWEKSDGENLSNRYKYPLFITITCEFSRFDNPYRPTAGEYTYWNPRGGAIAMITTIRSIFQGPAQDFNDRLSQHLLSYQNNVSTNNYTSIAEALRNAKNQSPNPSTNVVTFLGDPALMLAIPKPNVVLTAVNGQPISGAIDELQALALVQLSGEIRDENNIPLNNYNGELAVSIFDKPINRATLNNDGNAPPMNFITNGETIFRGNASVTNGQFQFSFIVPQDIRIPVGNGRVSFYAKRNQILLDKSGVNTDIKIGGINENAVADDIGPKVKLYMNDETFVSGGITNESPFFLAFLEDEHGINTASGIGHDIVAILDGNENDPYILNDYYETELDDFTKGKLRFPLRDLEKGLHTITFKAWDVYNNPVTAEIQFLVVGDESVTLTNVLNYPNPFVSYTQFWFTHNRPSEPLDVQVQVLTVTGKVVWTRNQVVTTVGNLSREITWDGRDDFGDKIGKGVYIYKLTVRSSITNSQTEKYEKLVIL